MLQTLPIFWTIAVGVGGRRCGEQPPTTTKVSAPLAERMIAPRDVVAVAQEHIEPEPLGDPEVGREALGADRVPGQVGPTHALGVATEIRLRCRRCHGEGDVASMQETEVGDAVREGRAADAPGVGPAADALLEVEPVEDELVAPVEQLGQIADGRDPRGGSRARPAPSVGTRFRGQASRFVAPSRCSG